MAIDGDAPMSDEERARRERERYNEGLDNRYRQFLLRSSLLYDEFRKARAREVFGAFDDPKTLEFGSYGWARMVEDNGVTLSDLTCINISEAEMQKGRDLARTSRNRPNFMLMDAQKLEFPDDTFDVVFGMAILHHLNMEPALREVNRVLKPGGRFFFHEPMDMNPVGRVIRALTPKARTDDERPFRTADIALIDRLMDCRFTYTEYASVPCGALTSALKLRGDNGMMKAALAADKAIAKIPGLNLWGRHVFIEGVAKKG